MRRKPTHGHRQGDQGHSAHGHWAGLHIISRSIIDKNAHIGDGAVLTNAAQVEAADEDNYSIRDGIIVVPKGAVIRPGTVI